MILIYILFALVALYLVLIYPGRGRDERMAVFGRQLIAHRGLHDNSGPAPENSLAAYRLAVEKGYGIELDVRETRDGMLVICHDDNLRRIAGIDKKIEDMSWSELREVHIFGSEETIPRFDDALKVIGGKVPLVCELKYEHVKGYGSLCENACFFLDAYDGPMCIESFHPLIVRWFRKYRPETLRGQLAEKFKSGEKLNWIERQAFSACLFNICAKPDFIAYNVRHRKLLRYRILHDLFDAYCIAWTVKSKEELEAASGEFEAFIFEGFEPEEGPRTPRAGADTSAVRKGKGRDMRNIIRKHMIVSGRVTAVGFRYRATWIAQELGISGWVRNLYTEQVEMELQGPESALDEMMLRLGREKYIRIDRVDEKLIPVHPDEYEFKVRY